MDGTGSINSFSAGILMYNYTVCTNKILSAQIRLKKEKAQERERRQR